MLFNRKEKNISEICLRQLEYIESGVIAIEKSLSKENVNKNYDKIMYSLNTLKAQIEITKLYEYIPVLIKKQNEINKRLSCIYNDIIKIGTESKKEILSKLDAIDNFAETDGEIKETLSWIFDTLELNNIEMENDITWTFIKNRSQIIGKLSNCGISGRQICSYERCIEQAISKRTNEAVHSLYEFIDNYQCNIQLPFNSYERISIRIMIELIITTIIKNINEK